MSEDLSEVVEAIMSAMQTAKKDEKDTLEKIKNYYLTFDPRYLKEIKKSYRKLPFESKEKFKRFYEMLHYYYSK